MKQNMREVVQSGYEADDYEKAFRADPVLRPMEMEFLDMLVQDLTKGARVLDLGSGTGLPYDQYLVSRGIHVTGVDFSPKHLARARRNVPQAEYIQGDFSKADFSPETFDAVTAFYAIFHLPRLEHAALFARMHRWLKPRGKILVTLGTSDMDCDAEADWLGAPMMWSSYPPEKYLHILKSTGFVVRKSGHEGAPGDEEYHYWLLAEKR
jgi:cyclopropane fatty-acyl-phospholipid synthase-like methyltransferase